MTIEAFERLPRKLGWKFEYYNGEAVLSPGSLAVVAKVAVELRSMHTPFPLRRPTLDDEGPLIDAYEEAFRDTVAYCDWPASAIEQSAREAIETYFGGGRGKAHRASRLVALDAGPDEAVVLGAALVREGQTRALLDLLFVRPPWQRKGLATALVGAVLNQLFDEGVERLRSQYLLANAGSRAWHRSFGFVDEPDLWVARAYYRHAQHTLWRARQVGGVGEGECVRLEKEAARWEREVERLERLAAEQGLDAVLPWRGL